jgi:2-polyprenyl-3-methyl-5-hydroxy-6-metoxy-1,4-benzoquinol methylase
MSSKHKVFETNIERKIRRKRELLEPHIGDSVLHLGAIGAGGQKEHLWLHGWLREQCDELLGIDIDEKIAEVGAKGYDVIRADAQQFSLAKKFDTIVATNIIEHVPNPGKLLHCCAEHLKPNGVVLLTTPRTHIPWNVLRELHGGMDPHPEHKMWFCRATLTALIESQELEVLEHRTWGFNRRGTTVPDKAWRVAEQLLSLAPPLSRIDEYQHLLLIEPQQRN